MARRPNPFTESIHPDAHRPDSLRSRLVRFLDWLRVQQFSAATVAIRRQDLEGFILWCEARDLVRLGQITRDLVERWQRFVYAYRKADGRPLAAESQARRLTSVRCFFRWAVRAGHSLSNPAAEAPAPKCRRRLPGRLLTRAEAETVLGQPRLDTVTGLRDRALLEVLYSTGIRRGELLALTLDDLDADRGMLRVVAGKGGADRWVAIGDRALWWVDRYLLEARPALVRGRPGRTLFVNQYGQPYSRMGLSDLVGGYIRAAGVGTAGACHVFRHTCATVMLEGGADIRVIQEQLGHRSLATTQIYTHVSNRNLKEVHRRCHPAANHPGRMTDQE